MESFDTGTSCPCLEPLVKNPSNTQRTYSSEYYSGTFSGMLDDTTENGGGYTGWMPRSLGAFMIMDLQELDYVYGIITQSGYKVSMDNPDRWCTKVIVSISLDGDEYVSVGELMPTKMARRIKKFNSTNECGLDMSK